MKKILSLSFLALSLVFGSCQNKELCYLHHGGVDPDVADVAIKINWATGASVPVEYGMRVNLFALSDHPHFGIDDVGAYGTTVKLPYNSVHRTFAYSYTGNNIYFRHQLDQGLIEAYCGAMTRATYSGTYPDEQTYAEPSGIFYVGENPSYTVSPEIEEHVIDVWPVNKLVTYTFEVRNVKGAQYISATRGAISGMSSSYFIGTGELSPSPSTILFDAGVDLDTERITGSFRTFGRLDAQNDFTIEILFPSNTNGILQKTWTVTPQISGANAGNFHIVIDDSGIEIPDEGGSESGGWNVDLNKWEDIEVPLGG